MLFLLPDEVPSNQPEIDNIDQQLKGLIERKDKLQQSYQNILSAKDKKDKNGESTFTAAKLYFIILLYVFCDHLFFFFLNLAGVGLTSNERIVSGPVPGSNIFFVDAPPTFPGELAVHKCSF